MKTKLGPNDLCPCGSGKKVKKCCKLQRNVTRYTQPDRLALLDALDHFIDTNLAAEEEQHYDDFWGVFLEREEELPRELISASSEVQFMSFCCDWEVKPQTTALDLLLAQQPNLSLGARAFARALRSTTLRLYEVTSLVPGISLTLRDLLEDGEVTVAERTASRTLNRYDWLAARIVESGCSGQPELEQGIMVIPSLQRERLHAQLVQLRASALAEGQLAAFQSDLPALIHEYWVGSVLEPQIPELHNTDGEPLLITHVHFEVLDRAQLERALDAHKSLSREDDRWSWSGTSAHGAEVNLGSIELRGESLVLETNSKERGQRGAQLLYALAQGAIAPRATTHEDPTHEIRERIKSGREDHAAPPSAISPEIAEAVVLDHYAKHYQQWLDEPVPALDRETPRAAAQQPELRERVVELIRGLERMYQQGLREGTPAYDPSWMWAELGLQEQQPRLPPPLPHERLAQFIDGADALIGEVAETLRKRPGFDDASTISDRNGQLELLDVQRFLKKHPPRAASPDTPSWQQRELAPYLELAVNFALHRKKVFWVDESLSFMLAHTDIDIPASQLRAPFVSFAIVFTDRQVLSLAERLLSRRVKSALRGLILCVATVYVVERHAGGERTLDLCFAFDALGDDLPELGHHSLTLSEGALLQTLLPEDDLAVLAHPHIATTSPLHALVKVVVNAMLYATSSDVKPETRSDDSDSVAATKKPSPRTATSESVYYLPGSIDITQLRKLQALSRVGDGNAMLRRSMVRGHWRKAAQSWSDQRLRWIAPYWKGPDLAAVIERAYRLKVPVSNSLPHS